MYNKVIMAEARSAPYLQVVLGVRQYGCEKRESPSRNQGRTWESATSRHAAYLPIEPHPAGSIESDASGGKRFDIIIELLQQSRQQAEVLDGVETRVMQRRELSGLMGPGEVVRDVRVPVLLGSKARSCGNDVQSAFFGETGYNALSELTKVSCLKGAPAKAILFSVMTMLASCATLPGPEIARTSIYRNVHDIQIEYPSSWRLEDMSKNYGSLRDAEKEGASYIQVYSYDPMNVRNPTDAVSQSQIKIAIIFKKNLDNLDYPKVLARIGNGISEKAIFRINGRDAYKVHYWITSEETAERLNVLSIEYLNQDLYARFICYPWNSMYLKEFEAIARSFRYNGK